MLGVSKKIASEWVLRAPPVVIRVDLLIPGDYHKMHEFKEQDSGFV
jgi:hypothetical protein